MFLSREEIDKSTRWLLENASAPVRYLTHRHILNSDSDSAGMQTLWNEVQCSPATAEIFSCQNEDGSWFSGGSWGPLGYKRGSGPGYTMSRPKFVTTAWILVYLGEMGFTTADERVRKACDLILAEDSIFHNSTENAGPDADCCGLSAIPLRALASVGMAGDEHLRGAWDWLLHCQHSDGGWINPRHLAGSPNPSTTVGRFPWDRSCAWGSYFALEALQFAGDAVQKAALHAALDFMLWHLAQADPTDTTTWVWHGHNIVKELAMFAAAGYNLQEKPLRSLLAWLKGYYRPAEGAFRAQEQPIPDFKRQIGTILKEFEQRCGTAYWKTIAKTNPTLLRSYLYHVVEDDWLTYRMVRMAMAMPK